MTDFLSTSNPQPQASGFGLNNANQGSNPYMSMEQQMNPYGGSFGSGMQDPQAMYQSASMIYQKLGYWNGNPTEIDIIGDLLKHQSGIAKFLASEQGLPIIAQLFSVLFDFKMTSFFKDFKLAIVQDDGGNMFIAPAVEQSSERGKSLATTTQAEVQTEMSKISETLKGTLIANNEQVLSAHRQAANIKAQSSGLSSILDEATGAKQGGGGLAKLVNFGARAAGFPVAPIQQGGPPPPPGR